MRFHTALKLLALTFVFAFLSAGVVRADNQYATIRGQVVDQTKATIPGAQVTATNTGTNEARTVTTQADGSFEFLSLPIGTYNISVTKDGFQTYQATGIVLVINQIYVINPTLQVGSASQTVTVEAARTQVETTSMQLGTTVEAKTIVDMPLNGRNWVQLQQLQPGVVGSSDRFGSNFATNGSESQQNSYLINGTDANDLPLNTPLILPSPDAIQEFRMITNTINPEYGRNSGAILDAVIKSGTNQFHGDAFEFYRDTFLNTRNFFQRSVPVFHQNQFGGTIGGPVWKNHTFFFYSYQGTRNATPGSGGNVTVFTPAEVAGNFTGAKGFLGNTNGSPIPLFGDSGSPCPFVNSGSTPCAAGTAYTTLFGATNSIPTQDFNSISAALTAKFVPAPNFGATRFSFNPTNTATVDQHIFQINQNFGQHDTVWFLGFLQNNPTTSTLPFTGSTLPGFPSVSQSHEKQFTGAWNHIFSANLLNEFRVGYTRLNFVTVLPATPTLPSTAGFDINPQDPGGAGLPKITITGFFTLGFSNNGPQPRIDQTKQLTDNLSAIMGRHTLKFGFEGRDFWVTNPFFNSNNGSFGFGHTGPFSTGNAGADFLLGFPDTYNQGSGNVIDARAKEFYFYAQDEFKLRPSFTLTYGLGYQIDTPLTDITNNRVAINCFRQGEISSVFPTAPTGLVFPGDPNCSASGYRTKFNDFGPRLGFAWSPSFGRFSGGPGNMSIRGGIGAYYNRGEEEVTLQNLNAVPFSTTSGGINDAGGIPSFKAPFTDVHCVDQNGNAIAGCTPSKGPVSIANKFPFSPPKPGTPVNFAQFLPLSLNVIDPNLQDPIAYNYNLTVQRQVPGQIIMTVGYVGAMGRHLVQDFELNPMINPSGCAADPACQNAALNGQQFSVAGIGDNPNFYKYNAMTFASLGNQQSTGTSNYNALQVTANKALSHGLTFLASYTWSHSLDFSSSFENSGFGLRANNPFNGIHDYGDSAFDARHRFVFSYDYLIPSWNHLRGMGWMPSRITDGWQITGIYTLQTGFPITIGDSGFTSLTCDAKVFYDCWDAPNVNGSVKFLNPRSNPGGAGNFWFDPASFSVATVGTYGNENRNNFHGPGINNVDMALYKNTRITEGTSLQLRIEFYNIMNHTQFTNSSIDTDVQSGTFGQLFSAANSRLIQLGAKFAF